MGPLRQLEHLRMMVMTVDCGREGDGGGNGDGDGDGDGYNCGDDNDDGDDCTSDELGHE